MSARNPPTSEAREIARQIVAAINDYFARPDTQAKFEAWKERKPR